MSNLVHIIGVLLADVAWLLAASAVVWVIYQIV